MPVSVGAGSHTSTLRRVGATAVLLVTAGAGVIPAQDVHAPVGVQIGYSRADLGGTDADAVTSRQGALAGVYLTFDLREWLALQPELLFALKGGRARALVTSGGIQSVVPLDLEVAYLEAPLVAKVAVFHQPGRIHPILLVGGAPALRIGCDLAATLPDRVLRARCEEAAGANFRRLDFGLVLGAGLQVDGVDRALALVARYTLGIATILPGADVHNRQVSVVLALNF